MIGSGNESTHATFGFVVNYREGDSSPQGNFVYQDHKMNFKLQATSFDLFATQNNHVWIAGTGILNDVQEVTFKVEIEVSDKQDQPTMFSISIPEMNGYSINALLSGGNIAIHK